MGRSLGKLAGADLANAIEWLGWRGSHIHEGIHKSRKSLREARATLALGGSVLGPGAELIDRELQRLNRELSGWRDGQALVDAIGRLLKRESDHERLAVLQRAQQAGADARAELGHAALAQDSPLGAMRALLGTLRLALPSLAWEAVTARTINGALATSGERRQKAIDRACSERKTTDWHRVRKRVRRLTQQYAVLEQLGIEEVARPTDDVKAQEQELAKRLGQAQDCVLLLDRCREHEVFAGSDRKIVRALARRQLKRIRRKAVRLIGDETDR